MQPSEIDLAIGMTVGIGLVVCAQVLSIVVALVLGGFRCGRLKRILEVEVSAMSKASFLETLRSRITELGFVKGKMEWQFIQAGAAMGSPSSFTHAGTKKMLTVAPEEHGVLVKLAIKYLDLIVCDTGECAYRDAVLDYLAGHTDSMQVVPNRSHMVVTAFYGSLLTLAAVISLIRLDVAAPAIVVMVSINVSVNVGLAIIGWLAIWRQPGRIVGNQEAVSALVVSLASAALTAWRYFLVD